MVRLRRDLLMVLGGLVGGVMTACMLTAGGQGHAGARTGRGPNLRSLTIEVTNARMVALPYVRRPPGMSSSFGAPPLEVDSSAPDPGSRAGADPAVTRTLGPFFVIRGDVVRLNGVVAHGTYVTRGVWFSNDKPPQPGGVAQESVSIDIAGRGTLFTEGIMLRSDQPAGILLGGTRDYAGVTGTYRVDGAVPPYGAGDLKIAIDAIAR